jgi:2-polyprenyl-3-methyl-5-hydroxy-6-metoxy-1,4-benzoquinol methylase
MSGVQSIQEIFGCAGLRPRQPVLLRRIGGTDFSRRVMYSALRRPLGRLKHSLMQKVEAHLLPKRRATACSKEQWAAVAQEGEFRFHKTNAWRQSDAFHQHSAELLSHFGFSPTDYIGKTIIDLGAGSKLRTRYFEGATLVAIEPLAERFLTEIPWSDLSVADRVYSQPAEERIEACVAIADLVLCINVLDHCYEFDRVVANIYSYLRDDGLAFLSFDAHYRTDRMHPLNLDEVTCESVFTAQGLTIERFSKGFGEKKRLLADGRNTYGHGKYCLNYWLRRGTLDRAPRSLPLNTAQ